MTQATTKDYWISTNALHIELNALGNPDYIQASCVSGARILVYVKDIIGYDAGHNYRRWSLQASPTVFNSHTEKYVYAAIPRSLNSAVSAWIVFPSEEIDIYGKNAAEEQIGDENYYYIFLQGIITSSGDNGTTKREWKDGYSLMSGYLSSDEALSAGMVDTVWYSYSQTDQRVTFLKDIIMKVGTVFKQLYAKTLTIVSGGELKFEANSQKITGIAESSTDKESTDKIVTPLYLTHKYLSKTEADTAKGLITFLRGIMLGSEYSISELGEAVLKSLTLGKYGITSTGDATLGEIASTDYDADEQRGYGLKKRTDGKYKLSLTDLEIWGKAVFHELEIRKLSYVGGNFVFSPAGSSLYYVEQVEGDWWCYILADDGEKATENLWKEGDLARCKTFNVKTGVYQNVQNKDYWRKVTWVSPNTYETDNSGKTILAGRKFHLIVLSATDCMTGSDIPAAGDDICCLGSKTQATERGNAVMINTTGDGAPSFIQYAGINDYKLDGKEVTKLSPSGNIIRGAFYAQNGTKELSIAIDEQGKSLDGLSKTIAELKVEADRISAKVDNVARTYRNLIPDSKVMLRSNGYMECATER